MSTFDLELRRWELAQDANGYNGWQAAITTKRVDATRVALLLCDVWDNHWSRGARERLDRLLPRMAAVVARVRDQGGLIIHAPSDTMDFYVDAPARIRAQAVPLVEPPPPIEHVDPPLPIDASDHGSDTGETHTDRPWRRQHPAIAIDPERDYIADDGLQVYSILQRHAIDQLLIIGVHTNMCVINRTFAIKQMVRWGVPIALIRDLTDAMYNPAMPPYVSHDEGTRLVVGYIEKFWCPSTTSEDLMRSA